MPFQIIPREVKMAGVRETVFVLGDAAENARIEVWPHYGFNCLRWQTRREDGSWGDIIYCDPTWDSNPVPTRSGHPILFPFPNRMNLGRFNHEGQSFQLPLNETSGKHAIHGFTPRNPWRVVDQGTLHNQAWITGEFHFAVDAPHLSGYWPTDFIIQISYRLHLGKLTVETTIVNRDAERTLPYGLGFHPYFACPNQPDLLADDMILQTEASLMWELEDAIPTGIQSPLPPELDFRMPRQIGPAQLDASLTGLPIHTDAQLHRIASLGNAKGPGVLSMHVPALVRDLVLFVPPHRKAVAIEPYTCSIDAANLQERGIEAGWHTVMPLGQQKMTVEYRWDAAAKLN